MRQRTIESMESRTRCVKRRLESIVRFMQGEMKPNARQLDIGSALMESRLSSVASHQNPYEYSGWTAIAHCVTSRQAALISPH